MVYSFSEMKQKNRFAYLYLLGLPEGLPFVLFCSLLGSFVSESPHFFTTALSFSANLAIYCFVQVYKHISNAPEDTFSPSTSDPNPISYGLVSLRSARIGLYLALLTAVTSAFLLGLNNLILTFSAVLLTLALFHSNIRLSDHLMLGFNQRHFMYAGIFLLNSIFTNRVHLSMIEMLFPLLLVTSLYIVFRLEEVRPSLPQHQTTTFWRFLFISILLISAVVTFTLLEPVPLWIIALWAFLASVQLSINFTKPAEANPHRYLYLLRIFEISGVISFLVYFIFVFITTFKR